MSDLKWKNYLLKSGLPFEHEIAEILSANGWHVDGQYSYSRPNADGMHTDFSVDLHGYSEFALKSHWLATLNLLIECKYASPGVNWIFSPYPTSSMPFSGCIKVFDQLANKRLSTHKHLEQLEKDIPYCIRGVSLSDSSSDENIVTRGIHQLRYAMPRLAERTFDYHTSDYWDEDIAITLACAILVTSAPIYVLKDELDLDAMYKAEKLEDVAFQTDAVIVWDDRAPDRERYSDDIYNKLISENEDFEERLTAYKNAFPSHPANLHFEKPSKHDIRRALRDSGNHILVVNYKSLGSYLKKLHGSTKNSIKSIRTLANVSYDQKTSSALITPVMKKVREKVIIRRVKK